MDETHADTRTVGTVLGLNEYARPNARASASMAGACVFKLVQRERVTGRTVDFSTSPVLKEMVLAMVMT